jgi:hypothetical protein
LVGNKLKLIAGDNIHDAIRKLQGAPQANCAVKGREAAGKNLSHGPRSRQSAHFIALGVLQYHDARELRSPRGGKARFSVPGRAIHPELAVVHAKNDTIIAKNFWIAHRLPKPSRGALAGAGVAEKQVAAGFRVDQSAAVDFNPETVKPQIMGEDEFVGGVLKRTPCLNSP